MDRARSGFHSCRRALTVAAGIFATIGASPAIAAPDLSTKLVRCGEVSCLRVTGYREDPASIVRINGNAVTVEGENRWKAYLPVETVRDWSAPNARSIEVSVGGPDQQGEGVSSVRLPVGMLAREINLAFLVVSAG